MYGLARVFNAEKYSMTVGGDFIKAWTLLLEYMENAAANKNVEVCCKTSTITENGILSKFECQMCHQRRWDSIVSSFC